MIRGAIAFGLVLKLDNVLPNKNVLVTSLLVVVIVTTIVYGSLVPIISAQLMKAKWKWEQALASAAGVLELQENAGHGHGHGHGDDNKEDSFHEVV